MAVLRTLDLPPMTLATLTTTEVAIPAGEWTLAAGVLTAKGWGEVRGLNGSAQVRPGVQLANDRRNPESTVAIGSVKATSGMIDPATQQVSAGDKEWIRPVWLVSLSGGSTLATASVIGTIVLEG